MQDADSAVPGDGSTADERRMQAYLSGDSRGFGELDEWIRSALGSRYPRLRAEFDDLTQTIHAKLVINLRDGRFEGRSALRSYVTAIAHRTAIDRLRQLYRDRGLTELDETRLPDARSNPYRGVESRDERRQLRQVLFNLPATCRELWKLTFVDRLDYQSIGERLSIPAGTVKSRMWTCRQHAIQALRRARRAPRRDPRDAGRAEPGS